MSRSQSLTVLHAPTSQDPLTEALASFYARCKARGLAARTVEFYSLRLERFRSFLGSAMPEAGPAQVTPAVIRDFLEAERERQSAAAAKKARTCLSAFFAYLTREGLVTFNPVEKVECVKAPEKVVRPLTEEEIGRLLEAAAPRTFLGSRLRALLLVMVDTGLRVSEACGLDLGDTDLNVGLLTVRHTKNGRERVVPLGRRPGRPSSSTWSRGGRVRNRQSSSLTLATAWTASTWPRPCAPRARGPGWRTSTRTGSATVRPPWPYAAA